jgi:hypothetical protein
MGSLKTRYTLPVVEDLDTYAIIGAERERDGLVGVPNRVRNELGRDERQVVGETVEVSIVSERRCESTRPSHARRVRTEHDRTRLGLCHNVLFHPRRGGHAIDRRSSWVAERST